MRHRFTVAWLTGTVVCSIVLPVHSLAASEATYYRKPSTSQLAILALHRTRLATVVGRVQVCLCRASTPSVRLYEGRVGAYTGAIDQCHVFFTADALSRPVALVALIALHAVTIVVVGYKGLAEGAGVVNEQRGLQTRTLSDV